MKFFEPSISLVAIESCKRFAKHDVLSFSLGPERQNHILPEPQRCPILKTLRTPSTLWVFLSQ